LLKRKKTILFDGILLINCGLHSYNDRVSYCSVDRWLVANSLWKELIYSLPSFE
jgi:hypothetical protein